MDKEMRLVDANAFEKSIQLSIASWGRDCNSNAPVIVRTYKDVLSRIGHAPTVDAVEVVHGRMVEVTPDAECPWHKVWECSLCGNRGDVWYNYCPNCGAKMDGGVDG